MQTAITLSVAVAASLCISTVLGYKFYQDRIPNGNSVPNPSGGIWGGVGHEAPEGKGPRNQFGVDFKNNNHVWNAALCNMDSDGDGQTNGQELGDPQCQWTQGGSFTPDPATGHPGLPEAQPLFGQTTLKVTGCTPKSGSTTTFLCAADADVTLTCHVDFISTEFEFVKDYGNGMGLIVANGNSNTITLNYKDSKLGKGEYICASGSATSKMITLEDNPVAPEKCENLNGDRACRYYADTNECTYSPHFMELMCRKACGFCTSEPEPPVDDNWGPWAAWSGCSATCGAGSNTRTRDCDSPPPPAHGGKNCRGQDRDTESCNEGPCPGLSPQPQPSVFSPGKDHALYLWIHLKPEANAKEVAKSCTKLQKLVDQIVDPSTRDEDTEVLAGVGFGPDFYSQAGGKAPKNYDYTHRNGTLGDMPSSGGDVFVHAKCNYESKLFQLSELFLSNLPKGSVDKFEDIYSFVYRNGRDLSGFIDGTENRADPEGREEVAVEKTTGGSYVITQKWLHNMEVIANVKTRTQEAWVGRNKTDSTELCPKSITSHVARMTSGNECKASKPVEIVRQSMPFGSLGGEKGLFFIGYAKNPFNFEYMLNRMVGAGRDGHSDDIMRLSKNTKGTYWYFPGQTDLAKLSLSAGLPSQPQPSVFSPGKDHALYLWIHLKPEANAREVAKSCTKLQKLVDQIVDPSTRDEDTEVLAGVGFGPDFYSQVGGKAPKNYNYTHRKGTLGDMPSSGGDVFVHAKCNYESKLFQLSELFLSNLPKGSVDKFEDIYSFVYRNGRDLSGFIDGTENRADPEGREEVAVEKTTGGSYAITQKWLHNMDVIANVKTRTQEAWVGRNKTDSTELCPKSITSHVARMTSGNECKAFKPVEIVRQSMPFGSLGGEKGLFFIGYAKNPFNFEYMLNRMVGAGRDGHSDDIMRLSKNTKGTYWYFPGQTDLAKLA